MTAPAVQPLPRERAPSEYNQLNEQRYRGQIDDELLQKHDRRSHLRVGRGKFLILASPGGLEYAIGLTDDGMLTVTDYSTGIAGQLIIDWGQIAGAEEITLRIEELEAQFSNGDLSTYAKITYVDQVVADEAYARATAITNLETSLTGQINTKASITQLNQAVSTLEGSIATVQTNLNSETSARIAGDAGLQTQVNNRATIDRVDYVETSLTNSIASTNVNLTAETTARQSADSDLQSQVDQRVTLAAFTSAISVLTSEIGAEAEKIEELSVSVQTGAQRPNLIPPIYQLFSREDQVPLTLVGGAQQGNAGATSINPFTLKPAQRVTSTSTTNAFMQVKFTLSNGQTNMVLPPGRYGYRVLVLTNNRVQTIVVRLRDADNNIVANQSHSRTTGVDQLLTGVLDLTASTVSEYYLELSFSFTAAEVGIAADIKRLQIEALPADATGPGDWSTATALNASIVTQAKLVADINGRMAAMYGIKVDGGGNGALFSLEDSTEAPSAVRMGADVIQLLAEAIYFGSKTTFEDTYGTLYTQDGGYRVRMLGPFPASGDLLLWAGSDAVPLNSETYNNGDISLSKSNGLWINPVKTGPLAVKFGTGTRVVTRTTAGILNTGPLTFAITGPGAGPPYTYEHYVFKSGGNGPDPEVTSTSGQTTAVRATGSPGDLTQYTLVSSVTDSAGTQVQTITGGALIWIV